MLSLVYLLVFTPLALGQYSATYLPANAPAQSEQGQVGTNQCGTGSSQTSLCQNSYINSVSDFCLWAPPWTDGTNSTIGNTEEEEVAWCMRSGYGTRLIPNGSIQGAHFVQTPDYVQVTGYGDLTSLNIPAGDEGGELDPHSWTGLGNPQGGLVFGTTFGGIQQYHEWTNFMSVNEFCFRACKDGPNAPVICNHVYDEMGCEWNMPANYDIGTFSDCLADSGDPMGVYGTSTWDPNSQQIPGASQPPAGPIPSSSDCTSYSTISNLAAVSPTATAGLSSSATTSANQTASTTLSTRVPSGSGASVTATHSGAGTASVSASAAASASASATGGHNAGVHNEAHFGLLAMVLSLACGLLAM